MKVISLNGTWALCGRAEGTEDALITLTATVPGCVQLDLAEAGYLPSNLYMGENIRTTEAYEEHEWWYERRFEALHVFEHQGRHCVEKQEIAHAPHGAAVVPHGEIIRG